MGTARKKGLAEQATERDRDLTVIDDVTSQEGRREGNSLIPHKSLLMGPTNQTPESSCGC